MSLLQTSNQPAPPTSNVRMNQVPEQLEALRKQADRMAYLLERLENKAHPILVPAQDALKEPGECYPNLVPVADEMRSISWRFDRMLNELDTIITRMEV